MRNAGGEAEVDELDSRSGFVKEDVFELDVSVSNISLVKVMNSKDHLLPQVLCFNLRHLTMWLPLQISMQRTTVDVFHDQEDLLVRLEGFVESSKGFMVDFFHDFDFSLDTLSTVWLEELVLLINFNCNLLIQKLVKTNSDNCVRSLPDSLADDIVINIFNCATFSAKLVWFSIYSCWIGAFLAILLYLIRKMCVVCRILVSIIQVGPLATSCDESSCLSVLQLPMSSKVCHGISHVLWLLRAILIDIVIVLLLLRLALSLLWDLPAHGVVGGSSSFVELNVVQFDLADVSRAHVFFLFLDLHDLVSIFLLILLFHCVSYRGVVEHLLELCTPLRSSIENTRYLLVLLLVFNHRLNVNSVASTDCICLHVFD